MSRLNVSLSEISSLTKTLQNVEDLDISLCPEITETGFISLLDIVGGHLRKLNLSNSNISLSAISSLTTTLPNLEYLNISSCPEIPETGFISLLNIAGALLRKLKMRKLGISLSEISSLTTTLPNPAGVLKRLTMTDPRLHEVARLKANFSN